MPLTVTSLDPGTWPAATAVTGVRGCGGDVPHSLVATSARCIRRGRQIGPPRSDNRLKVGVRLRLRFVGWRQMSAALVELAHLQAQMEPEPLHPVAQVDTRDLLD